MSDITTPRTREELIKMLRAFRDRPIQRVNSDKHDEATINNAAGEVAAEILSALSSAREEAVGSVLIAIEDEAYDLGEQAEVRKVEGKDQEARTLWNEQGQLELLASKLRRKLLPSPSAGCGRETKGETK